MYHVARLVGGTPLQGAHAPLYAATEPSLRNQGGIYIGPSYYTNLFHTYQCHAQNPRAYDHEARAVLWERTLKTLKELRDGEEVMPRALAETGVNKPWSSASDGFGTVAAATVRSVKAAMN